jgi:hypothetical protein
VCLFCSKKNRKKIWVFLLLTKYICIYVLCVCICAHVCMYAYIMFLNKFVTISFSCLSMNLIRVQITRQLNKATYYWSFLCYMFLRALW